MSFHTCPFVDPYIRANPSIQKMPFVTTRTPLRVRAERLSAQRTHLPDDIDLHDKTTPLILGSNRVTIEAAQDGTSELLIAKTISHFLPVAQNMDISMWFKYVNTFGEPVNIVGICGYHPQVAKAAFKVSLVISHPDMFVSDLVSNMRDCGGTTLAAIYNFAKDLDIGFIRYEVASSNTAAKRFYFHMDFGRPLNRDLTDWVVGINSTYLKAEPDASLIHGIPSSTLGRDQYKGDPL